MAGKRAFGTVDRRPNGKFRARYIGPDGKQYTADTGLGETKTFLTEAAARRWLARAEIAIEDGKWVNPFAPKIESQVETFGTYALRWVAERNLRPRTREEYYSLLRNHLLPNFGHYPLVDITAPMVRTWRDIANDKRTVKARAYCVLSSIMLQARDDELIPRNPCMVAKGGTAKVAKTAYIFTNEEMDRVKANLPDRYRAMVDLGCWASLRIGEVLALRRGDLNLTATTVLGDGTVRPVATVSVSASVTRTQHGLAAGPPKTDAGIRTVELPPHVIPRLQEHLNTHVKPDDDALLFPAATQYTFMCHSTVQGVLNTAVKNAGIRKGVTFHDLRHTGQTKAAQAGATVAALAARAGQSDLRTAMRYTHNTPTEARTIADRMQ